MPQIKSLSASAMAVAGSALRAQQARMRIIAENIANADSTSATAGGDPYRRQVPVRSALVADRKGESNGSNQLGFRDDRAGRHP